MAINVSLTRLGLGCPLTPSLNNRILPNLILLRGAFYFCEAREKRLRLKMILRFGLLWSLDALLLGRHAAHMEIRSE